MMVSNAGKSKKGKVYMRDGGHVEGIPVSFADGGLVDILKSAKERLMGPSETMTQKFARQDAERAAKTPPVPATPPPTFPASGVGDYVGNPALEKRMKAAGMANGGMVDDPTRPTGQSYPTVNPPTQLKSGGKVKGPGTGTSDSIPAMLSHGEFVMPADSVRTIGAEKLMAMKDATHTPSGKPDMKNGMPARVDGTKDEEVKRMLAQIPTQGYNPAPAAQPTNLATGTELGRNVSNTLMALPGISPAIGAARTLASASPIGTALSGVGGGASSVAPYGVPAAAVAALGLASASPEQTQPVSRPPVAQTTRNAPINPTAAPNSVDPSAGRLGAGKPVSDGATRFDQEGKSPLFTNRTDAAGLADNASLVNRGPVTAQNRLAMQGIQDRQDAQSVAAGQKDQYAREVAQAQAINKFQADRNLTPQQLALRSQNEQNIRADATERYKVDANSASFKDTNRTAQQRLAMDKESQGYDNRTKAALEKAQTELAATTDEAKKLAIIERIRSLQSNYEKLGPPDLFGAVAGEKNADGSQAPPTIYNKRTGELPGGPKPVLPPGMIRQVGTSGGKPVYEDKNGKRFSGN